jgi:hypothetical protein
VLSCDGALILEIDGSPSANSFIVWLQICVSLAAIGVLGFSLFPYFSSLYLNWCNLLMQAINLC